MKIRFCLLLLFTGSAALAEDVRTIVVTGRGLEAPPGSAAYDSIVVPRKRLTESASGRIEDVLSDSAGFQQFRRSDSRSANPSAQGATLRGLGGNASSRALVLLDGVPQADPFFGYIPFSALAPERLSSARITRGGGAGAFGAGAVAGTIELASATRNELPTVSGSAFYGSRDSQEVAASTSPDLGSGYATFSGRWERGDGFFTTPKAQRVTSSARARYEDWSAGFRAVAPLDPQTEIQARGLIYRDDRTLRFKGADSSSDGEDASIRLVHRGRWQVDALAYLQSRNFSNIVISATSFRKTLDQRNTPSTGLGGKIELRPPVGGRHILRVGADVRAADGELFEDAYSAVTGLVTARRNAGGKTSTAGAFIEDDWSLGKLVLTGGARADRWTITDGFFSENNAAGVATSNLRFANRRGWEGSVRFGGRFEAPDGFAIRAAAYTGFRLPTLNELYRPFVVFPITTRANEGLGLEKLKGAEAGLNFAPAQDAGFGITLFYNRLDNAIANVTIGPNLRQRRNVDAIVAQGIEATANARFGDVRLSASYAYSHSIVHASGASAALDGLTPAQTPRHAASATVTWYPEQGPSLSTTLRYTGNQFEDDLETDTLPHALTLDAFLRVPFGRRLSLIARAENIFDEKVVTRKVGASTDLGTPRTLWIGLKFAAD